MKQKKVLALGNSGGLALVGLLIPVLAGLDACGTTPSKTGGFTSSGSGSFVGSGSGAAVDEAGVPIQQVPGDDGGSAPCLACGEASAPQQPTFMYDGGMATGTSTAADCPGCTFPPLTGAPACPTTPAPITVVYPPDTVLLPPNLNLMSVQWTPFGAPFTNFEVDFENGNTDIRIITKCATQTTDTGTPSMPSGGCELVIPPAAFQSVETANRGGAGVNVTVRGTTDGKCATASAPVQISFAEEDLLGTYYYWKSTVSTNGVGGQIWKKTFGDLSTPEANVTQALPSTCNGCHVLSRDGTRMVVYSDDNDSDDEYSDVWGLLLDTGVTPPVLLAGSGQRNNGQPPGFSTLHPAASLYLTSNGTPNPPTNNFLMYSAVTGAPSTPPLIPVGVDGQRPTMPDWSPDATSVIYVLPQKTGDSWQGDDDHEFGGSLYTLPYMGNQVFGTPTAFLQSKGENNYYPSYSPDSPSTFVVFDRTPLDTTVGPIDGCVGTEPKRACPNDSFSNPAARLMLTGGTAGKFVIDLEKANGSPASKPVNVSNSFPKWTPFVQTYHGQKMFWVTFSSTRDYGIRVLNHKTGMYQCYPPDSFELPMGQHHGKFAPECQQPQLWMAPITLNEGFNGMTDPSHVAFWIPYQDITTHNHTPQWTHQKGTAPPPPMCIPSGANCLTNPTACCNSAGSPPLICTGNGKCGQILN